MPYRRHKGSLPVRNLKGLESALSFVIESDRFCSALGGLRAAARSLTIEV
jgi:hypothetical protein